MRRNFKERLRKERRTIPIPATDGGAGREKTDHGNLYRCWHCGFVCDVRRDELSAEGRHGAKSAVYVPTAVTYSTYGRGPLAVMLNAGIGHDVVLMKQDAAGNTATIYHRRTVSGTGCPNCHSRAWKQV